MLASAEMPMTWDARASRPDAVPSETSAETSGSAAANSEPNTSARTTAAARIPIPAELSDGFSPSSASWPPAAARSPAPSADATVRRSCLASGVDRCHGGSSKVTVA